MEFFFFVDVSGYVTAPGDFLQLPTQQTLRVTLHSSTFFNIAIQVAASL